MKRLIIMILAIFVLSGCFSKEAIIKTNLQESNVNNNIQNNINIKTNSNIVGSTISFNNKEVETQMNGDTLIIKGKTKIQEGRADDFPKDFKIIQGAKIYKNSNMQKYAFLIVEGKTLDEITNYYINELQNNGYILEENAENDNINNLDQVKVTSNNLVFKKNISEQTIEKISLNINMEIPKLLKENFSFRGFFVEIKFNYLAAEQENIEQEVIN